MAKPGRKPGQKNYQVDRYAGVKLRQRMAEALREANPLGTHRLYNRFATMGWIPKKSNNEPLELGGFCRYYEIVKKDLNHKYSNFFLLFLQRACAAEYQDRHGRIPYRTFNGLNELSRLTGLQETTLRDILILEGVIE